MENLTGMSVEDLKELLEAVNDHLAEAKAVEKANAEAEKEARAEMFRGVLEAGDKVTFLYGSKNELNEGTVVRVSEKSVTVESDVFSKGKNYVHFDRFVEVLEKAEVFEDEAEEEEDSIDEAI